MSSDGLDVLRTKDFFLYNTVITEQRRQPDTDFVTPRAGREGGNGLICLMAGDINYHFEGCPVRRAEPGDLIFLPKLSHYRCDFIRGNKEPICRFQLINFEIMDTGLRPIRLSESLRIIRPGSGTPYENRFSELLRMYRMGVTPPARIKARVLDILTDVAGELHRENLSTRRYAGIGPGIRYLEQHFTENISIAVLAELCFVSETSFRRLFHHYAGMSPVRYRTTLRIDRARELLRSGLFTASEAAAELGFGDSAYFSRVFKDITGMSPGEYSRRSGMEWVGDNAK